MSPHRASPLHQIAAALALMAGCGGASATRPPAAPAVAQDPPPSPDFEPHTIRAVMAQAADRHLPAPGAIVPPVKSPVDTERAVFLAGLTALAELTDDVRYLGYLQATGQAAGWRPGAPAGEGELPALSQTFLALYLRDGDRRMIEPLLALIDGGADPPAAARTAPGSRPWPNPDALFITAPALALAATATSDLRHLATMDQRWWKTADALFDRDAHLFDSGSDPQPALFTSRDNGLALAALVRVLENLPDDHQARPRYQALLADAARALAAAGTPAGRWPARWPAAAPALAAAAAAAPAVAANFVGDALISYALAWGVNHEVLDRAVFAPLVQRAWTALVGASRAPLATREHTGALLLAGSEVFRLALFEDSRATALVVTNPLAEPRASETVEIAWPALASTLGAAPGDPLVVVDARSGRLLPAQLYDGDGDGAHEVLLASLSFLASDARRLVVRRLARPFRAPRLAARAYGRFVPESMDDFAWENDRVAFRVYGPALAASRQSSGIDVWAKRVRRPVIDEWYRGRDYHRDHGDGLDFYRVGPTRGCGGIGWWDGQNLHTSRTFRRSRLLAPGPVRVAFEVTYDPWGPPGQQVVERKRISLDLGQSLSRVEVRFSPVAGPVRRLPVAVGIVQRGEGTVARDVPTTWFSYVEPPQGDSGQIGCGVVIDAGAARFVDTNQHFLLVTDHPSDRRFLYYAGAYWSKAPDFREPDEWSLYLAAFARRSGAPVSQRPAEPVAAR
jgi:unsaturated rhamnogalacturonyl hydrolase